MCTKKQKKWLKPMFDFDEPTVTKLKGESTEQSHNKISEIKKVPLNNGHASNITQNFNHQNWMKIFEPKCIEDLVINNKKIQEIQIWIKSVCDGHQNDMLLLSGPVGCGKTTTIQTIAAQHNIKVSEWITPLDIDIPSEYGDFEFKEKQSKKFLDFIINAANFTSLIDNNSNKLVLVEDFPNTFIRSPTEFVEVLFQYKQRAKSPIVFICSELHSDNRNTALDIFTPSLKEQFNIHHISLNGVSATGLKNALKRVADIMVKKHNSIYTTPSSDLIECVVNSSTGDVRSAVLNLHFACLKGSNINLETSFMVEKEPKTKPTKRKKASANKFQSIGKDQTVGILHGVGRVLNPKVLDKEGFQKFTHEPCEIVDQFLSQPNSFVNFLGENYLPHFSCIDDVVKAASVLSDSDYMLGEWKERMCYEYGLYVAVAGLMVSNKSPVSAWNPVRGPKNIRVQYPSLGELPKLEENFLYKGKVLVTDYQTYYKIIDSKNE